MQAIQHAAEILLQARFAVALTGAGISTPSGIPDFRSESGLWQKSNAMQVAHIDSFRRNPIAFYEWMTPLAKKLLDAQPNPAHTALTALEKAGRVRSIITQNIDCLHRKAGSKTVYEVHGHIRTATCQGCGHRTKGEPLLHNWLAASESERATVAHCEHCGNYYKPDVVLFGERLPIAAQMGAETDISRCDALLVAGSSLEVYPIADLPRQALANGAKLIIVDYNQTAYDRRADVVIHNNVADVLPRILEAVKAKI